MCENDVSYRTPKKRDGYIEKCISVNLYWGGV